MKAKIVINKNFVTDENKRCAKHQADKEINKFYKIIKSNCHTQ